VRDRPGAGHDRAPPLGHPRGRVVRVDLVDLQQPRRLGRVRGEHGAPRQRDLVPQPGQHAEREGVEQHRRVPAGERAEHRPDQRRGALGLVEPRAHDHGVGALELRRQVRRRRAGGGAVGVLRQGQHAGLGSRHGERRGDRLGHRERQPPGADPERRQAGERRGARGAAGAADDEHAAADVLGAVPGRQRPAAQQRRGEGGGVSHRPAPGAR